MVELLDPRPGETLLELACGPGDTGLLAAERVLPGGRLLSTDAAPEMVEAARRRAQSLGLGHAEFRVADAQHLDLPDRSIDGVLCRFGVMLVPDCAAAFGEVARVLRPGGRAALAVWGPPEQNDQMTAAGRAVLELGLAERPGPDAPGPFRLADPARLRALTIGAGLHVAALEDVPVVWRHPSLADWWETTLDVSRMVTRTVQRLSGDALTLLRDRAEARLAAYLAPDGSLAVPGLARVLLARKPGG